MSLSGAAVKRSHRFRRMVVRLIDFLSFNTSIRDIADGLNRQTTRFEEPSISLMSHPGGFTRAFRKRRMGIAEAYILVAKELELNDFQKRLYALNVLMSLSFHAKTVGMPLNTARVQIELMKEAVKSGYNRRRQKELIADFSIASYGHEAAIRKFLRELKRIETPETGKRLRELDLGWDSHVHDNLSAGRKTPSQVMLDAFIKGISRLTLVYYDIPHRDILFEALEAGKILGIDVAIALEFSIGGKKFRKHFLFLPPTATYDAFLEFFDHNCRQLAAFVDGLEENKNRRRAIITEILDNFNNTHRITLNHGYEDDSIFSLPKLKLEDLEKLVIRGQFSRNHLSELLFARLSKVLKYRTIALRVKYEVSRQLLKKEFLTGWEMERIEQAYLNARHGYAHLSPADLKDRYFTAKHIVDYDSAFSYETGVLSDLKAVGGDIIFSRPLEHGLAQAVLTILKTHAYLDKIELMNMRDSIARDPADIIRLAQFIDYLNNGKLADLIRLMENWEIPGVDEHLLRAAHEKFQAEPLIPLAASASTGWKPQAPGMGFIKESQLPKKSRKYFIKTHYRLPIPVSALIAAEGRRLPPNPKGGIPEIYCLGKSGQFRINQVGDEEELEWIGFRRLWRYLNPGLKNLIRIGIGFVPAYLWIGHQYALLWFGITALRNVLVDLFALSGFRPRIWSVKDVNLDNTSQSLFWTGFSVPILGFVKEGFDKIWPYAPSGPVFEWTKFFFICFANGMYIASHNKIRQFDHRVIRANFFRSLLAWPLSALFSPIGNALKIPAIVQAKFWSDVVAALIEGTGKFHQKIILRKRDLLEILPLLLKKEKETRLTAMLDILFIWSKRQRGASCLLRILTGQDGWLASRVRSFKKQTPASLPGPQYLPVMIELFSPEQSHADLMRMVLRKCTEQEILSLSKLIQDTLVPFHKWLKDIDG